LGEFILRVSLSLAVMAFALAGSLGQAAAQYYPPAPVGYPPPPAYPYPAYPPPPAYEYLSYPSPNAQVARTSAASDNGFAPQSRTGVDGGPIPLPPADVGRNEADPDITGSVSAPPDATPAAASDRPTAIASLPPEYQPEQGPPHELAPRLRRQLVDYNTTEPAGTIIVDTPNTYLYLVLGHGKALRYGIGVGREGFTWSGVERIRTMKKWPDWFPPKEMIERQPYLPRFMAGGESNPLGARALYLGNTLYRIHGTNQPSTIGTFMSSGCIRLTNDDIRDLYDRVNIGTRVVVLPGSPPNTASTQGEGASPQSPVTR
jgi:lipoprotein-anchoring transpeptidase ErfK/SrfK